jgi:hypothetical protein
MKSKKKILISGRQKVIFGHRRKHRNNDIKSRRHKIIFNIVNKMSYDDDLSYDRNLGSKHFYFFNLKSYQIKYTKIFQILKESVSYLFLKHLQNCKIQSLNCQFFIVTFEVIIDDTVVVTSVESGSFNFSGKNEMKISI